MRINPSAIKIYWGGLFLLTLPFAASAQTYSIYNHNGFDPIQRHIYKPGNNLHTSVKPYRMDEINRRVSADSLIQRDLRKPSGKLNLLKRFIHEDFVSWSDPKGPIFIRINPLFNFEVGKESSEGKNVWINTRGVMMEGAIGKNMAFYADFHENQGVFPGYLHEYIAFRKVVPGQGRVKDFGSNGYDFSQATGYFSYNAGNYFNLQLGFGKNFIGDGYRSLLLSDNTYSYPHFKMTTTFGKIKYLLLISQFQQLDTLRRSQGYETVQRFPAKYGAFHYLNWNLGKRVSVGIFESVIWTAQDSEGYRGLDMNYLVPLIFYRPVEYGLGSPDNMTIGANLKVILWPDATFYGQLVLGEFKLDEILSGDKWWANKQGFQLGFKSYNFMGIDHLDFQAEYNQVRPYTYSHYLAASNYGHFNQELAHPLGANFREGLAVLRYRQGRWHFEMQTMYAMHGRDFDDQVSFGGDIFVDNQKRDRDRTYGNEIGQGLQTTIFNGSAEVSFLINPKNNMNLALGFRHRQFSNDRESGDNNLLYFTLRTSLRNFYYDF